MLIHEIQPSVHQLYTSMYCSDTAGDTSGLSDELMKSSMTSNDPRDTSHVTSASQVKVSDSRRRGDDDEDDDDEQTESVLQRFVWLGLFLCDSVL